MICRTFINEKSSNKKRIIALDDEDFEIDRGGSLISLGV